MQADKISIWGQTIEVVVGSSYQATFYVHKELVCESSEYFKRLVENKQEQSKKQCVKLRDNGPDAFKIYLQWLYRGTIPLVHNIIRQLNLPVLAWAYVLGDRLEDGKFRDSVVDSILEICSHLQFKSTDPFGGTIQHVYERTPEEPKLRLLLADICAYHGCSTWITASHEAGDYPKEFFLDLSVALLSKKKTAAKDDPKKNRSKYYLEHQAKV